MCVSSSCLLVPAGLRLFPDVIHLVLGEVRSGMLESVFSAGNAGDNGTFPEREREREGETPANIRQELFKSTHT